MPQPDQIRIPIDKETHRLLRIEAAKRDMTIRDVIALLVRKALADE